jgi:hypothetical protein
MTQPVRLTLFGKANVAGKYLNCNVKHEQKGACKKLKSETKSIQLKIVERYCVSESV